MARTSIALVAGLLGLALAPGASAQITRATPGQPEARTALQRLPVKGRLTVTTPAFRHGGDIPLENTQYRGNLFPGLEWAGGPGGAKSYAVVLQDSSFIRDGMPILHWTLLNIPADISRLKPRMKPDEKPAGSIYGPALMGSGRPYAGPRTPPGVKDDYHFQVFALDTVLPASAADSYLAMLSAMDGPVLASGEVVGVGQADPAAPPRANGPRPAEPGSR